MTPIARPSSPRVLLPPPPRQAIRRRGLNPALKAMLFFLIPHVWIGLGLIAVIANGIVLSTAGQLRTGRVTDRKITHGKSTNYQISYAYEESGRRYQDHATVSSSAYDRLPPGNQLDIKSFHFGPLGGSRLAGALDHGGGSGGDGIACMAFFAVLWNGFMFGLFYALVLAPLHQRALVRDGCAVPGRVVSRRQQKAKGTTYTINYFFMTLDGRPCSRSMTVRPADYNQLCEGDDITVLYDPNPRNRSIIYDCCDYLATDDCGYPIHP